MVPWWRQLEFVWGPPAAPAAVAAGSRLRDDPGLTAWCAETAAGLGLPKLARRVAVAWNPRMRTTAGRAWWPHRTIELNARLRELPPDQMWRTLRHELAHLIAYERAGKRPIQVHGPEWRQACRDLGIPNESPYHDLPFRRRLQKRRFLYTCPHCEMTLRRVRRFRHAVACWPCCRRFNGGRFDTRFRLIESRL